MADKKSFSELTAELKDISNKLNSPETSMEDALDLYKRGESIIKEAKEDLDTIEVEVKKVLANDEVEKF